MANEERRLTLLALVDERAARQSEQRVKALQKGFQGLERAEMDATQASRRTTDALGDVNRGSQTNVRFLQTRIDAMQEFTQHLEREIRLLKEEEQALRRRQSAGGGARLPATGAGFQAADEFNSLVRQRAGLLGDVDTALQTLGGAVSGISPGLGGGARVAGDVFAAAEAIPQLQGALKGLPAVIQATSAALVSSGGLSTSLAATIGPVATVGGAALIAAPALIAMGIAIKKFIERINEGKGAISDALDAQRLYAEAVAGGTRESIQAQLEELRVRQEARKIERDLLQQQIDDLNLIQRLLGKGQFKKQLDDTNDTIRETENAITRLEQALDDERVVQRSAAEAAEQNTDSQDVAAKAEQIRQQATQGVTGATQEATRAEEQRATAIQQSTVALRQQVAQTARDRLALQAESQRLLQQAQTEGADALQSLVQKAQDAASKAARALDASLARIGERLAFNVSEFGFDRRFTDIAAARRQAAFDIATTRRDARLDDVERNIDLQRTLEEERVRQEKQINDLVAQRVQIEQEALRNIVQTMLQATNSLVRTFGGAGGGGAGLTAIQQRQVQNMIGAGLGSLTR